MWEKLTTLQQPPAARQVWMQNTCKQTQPITKGEFDFHLTTEHHTQSVPTSISIQPQVSLTSAGCDVRRHTNDHPKWTRAAFTLCDWNDQAGWLTLSAVFSTDRMEHKKTSSTPLSWLPSLNTSYNPFMEKQPMSMQTKTSLPQLGYTQQLESVLRWPWQD